MSLEFLLAHMAHIYPTHSIPPVERKEKYPRLKDRVTKTSDKKYQQMKKG